MPRRISLSLRSKALLFLISYTLVLEGGILTYFFYSGAAEVQRRSYQEARVQAAAARSAVEEALADAVAEVTGLRLQLLLYPIPAGALPVRLIPAEELVVAFPRKYAEIGLLDRLTRQMLSVRAVREFNQVYPVVETRSESAIPGECPEDAGATAPGAPCVLGLQSGSGGEELVIIAPLSQDGPHTLVASIHVDSLLEAIDRLPSPAGLTVLASNPRGLILHAPDVSLLRTYIQNASTDFGFPSGALRMGEGSVQRKSGATIAWTPMPRPGILLAARKDDGAELRELRMRSLRGALFTAGITLLAFLGVWGLTGRMAVSLRHVTEVADSVAGGDFSGRIAIRRKDELGSLITSFNLMSEKLEGSYRALREVNRELQGKVEELTRTRRRLTRKQRLALVGEALSRISHEIQNKIGGVGVWVQNLERCGEERENRALCISEMKGAINACRDMLVHYKRFYRQPQLEKKEIPAKQLIDACLVQVRAELEAKGLSVRADFSDAVRIEVDEAQMKDAIVNILLNAAWFSPDRGTLEIGLRQNHRYVILSFLDRGPGIPAKARLFQPFYTTRTGGSGLGLAVVRNIVVAHAGRIRASNREGGGACFAIYLPAPAAGSERPPDEPSGSGDPPTRLYS